MRERLSRIISGQPQFDHEKRFPKAGQVGTFSSVRAFPWHLSVKADTIECPNPVLSATLPAGSENPLSNTNHFLVVKYPGPSSSALTLRVR
jgi:hypothetical protein